MLTLNNTLNIKFSNMGLFKTDSPWTHPHTKISTYELIFVTSGKVMLYEGAREFTLNVGDMILLKPDTLHGGFKESSGLTSFYWLHFHTDSIEGWSIPKTATLSEGAEKDLREIMHYSQTNQNIAEVLLAKFLLELSDKRDYKNKTAFEIREYIRINANISLTVSNVAGHFGYSEDYVSRLMRDEFGNNLKTEIIRQRLSFIESLLINTDDSIKKIAEKCSFSDENTFVKFFKYHEKTTPTKFRQKIYRVHMNNK